MGEKKETSSASATASEIKTLLNQANLPESADAIRLDRLRRIFAQLVENEELNLSNLHDKSNNLNNSNVKVKWNEFLRNRHRVYLSQLCDRIRHGRRSTLRTTMGVIASSPNINYPINGKVKSDTIDENPSMTLNHQLLHSMLCAIVHPFGESMMEDSVPKMESGDMNKWWHSSQQNAIGPTRENIIDLLDEEFIKPYKDVQYFLLLQLEKLANEMYRSENSLLSLDKIEGRKSSLQEQENDCRRKNFGQVAENLLRVLIRIQVPNSEDDLEANDLKDGTYSNYLFVSNISKENSLDDDDDIHDNDDNINNDEDDSDDDDYDEEEEQLNGKDQEPKRKKQRTTNIRPKSKSISKKPNFQTLSQHRRALQSAHLAVLRLPHLPPRALRRALQHIPTNILPHVSSPLRFADFCTRAYDVGGITGILALHGLFILMTKHGLEYPNFYSSLYKLVDTKAFHTKHRTRFFRLLSKCLTGSQMLPAYIVASFCKRLCRCALSAPPSGALFVLALTSNLLRKHAETACLIHRNGNGNSNVDITKNDSENPSTSGSSKIHKNTMGDPFDADTDDPSKSCAIESSLWELDALERHYHPAVSTMAKSVGREDPTKTPMHNLEEFLLHTYKSLFDTERKREKNKKIQVPLTFHEPKGLFVAEDVFANIFDVPVSST
mmetsp:Transcript_3642/g.5025  ORF Transcript_3642/g.5025 Transcript_3642/m.5025 type:complete len:665 (-) Transcript_3642:104-2098(-)